ncbi:MAG: hypothetical protein ACO1OQ_15715 [Rufibacter sp.]
MDKLTRYNQKLLAVFGTILIIGASLAILIGLGFFLYSIFQKGTDIEAGVQLQNTNVPADAPTVRTQQISFGDPVQVDSAKAMYLIPVGQVNLEVKEKIYKRRGIGSSSNFEGGYEKDGYIDSYDGIFNNFILYEHVGNTRTRLFSNKVAIHNWSNVKIKDTKLLLFTGADTDSNKDNLLDEDDFQNLYVYFLGDKKLVPFKLSGRTVLNYEVMENTNLIYIKVGVDKNKDFKFDWETEPKEILTLNIHSRKLEELVLPGLKKEIQSILDK